MKNDIKHWLQKKIVKIKIETEKQKQKKRKKKWKWCLSAIVEL